MFEDLLNRIDLSRGAQLYPILIGLVASAVALLSGRLVMRRFGNTRGASISDVMPQPPKTGPVPKSIELRGASRRGGNAVAVFVADPHKTDEPKRGWVVDRSAGGLRLALENPVVIGTRLRVRVCNAPVTIPWAEVEVKNCRKDDNSWEIGCQFAVTPSYNVLMLFG